MNLFRMTPALAAAVAWSLVAGSIVGSPAYADERADDGKSFKSCREEVWRVSRVENGNPGYMPLPRQRQRTVLVCDEKVLAEIQRRTSNNDK